MTDPTGPTDIQLYFLWRNHVQAQFETLGLTNTDAGGGLGGFDLGFDGPDRRVYVTYKGPTHPARPSGPGVELPEPGGSYEVSVYAAADMDAWYAASTDLPRPAPLAEGVFLTAVDAVEFTREHVASP